MSLRSRLLVLVLGAFLSASGARAEGAAAPWDRENAQALLGVISDAGLEGLNGAGYDSAAVQRAAGQDDAAMIARADAVALALARDFYEGQLRLSARRGWHFSRQIVDYLPWLEAVKASHSVRGSYAKLLPEGRDYAGLRGALAACRTAMRNCAVIEANLDRWRALPRQFGRKYLWVNVPAYRLDLIESGRVIASHKVIVGKPGTRTPLFRAMVTGATANPWWNVPCSIVDESIGKLVRTNPREAARRGFVATTDAQGKLVVRQKPGPGNALGKLKLEMPNPYGVYIHDTPTRDLFARDTRALSHGCIRTDQPDALARTLLGEERAQELDLALIMGTTKTIKLPTPIPVYVVYLTAEADPSAPDGVVIYRDIYPSVIPKAKAR